MCRGQSGAGDGDGRRVVVLGQDVVVSGNGQVPHLDKMISADGFKRVMSLDSSF